MTVKIFVPKDAAAVALGANKIAARITERLKAEGTDAIVVRNGSRGMHWLEPLVEVETADGRLAYGPVTLADVDGLFAAGFATGGTHALSLGLTEEIPFLKNQTRHTFARCGIIDPLVARRLQGAWRLEGPAAHRGHDAGRRG